MPATAEGNRQIAKHRSEHGARWQPTAEERVDLAAIDAAIDRMRTLTAPDPYVLTIPQDVEPRYYHAYRAQAQQWLCNTPFSSSEHETLQYQTFHYYEHGKQMYVQQNSRPQEARIAANGPRSNHSGTGANTPTPAPKKKISLDAYKKKQSGQPSTPEPASAAKGSDATAAQQSALKGPIERVKAETDEMLAAVAVAESEETHPPARKSDARLEKKDLKRKRDEREATTKENPPSKLDKHSETRPKADRSVAQKAHRSPSPTYHGAKSSMALPQTSREPKTRPKEAYDETQLPPRLSPGMPPRLSPLRHPGSPKVSRDNVTPPLPPMLSPTIPDNILATLKARELYHNGSKDEKATRKAEEAAKRRSPVPRNGFRAISSSPAVRSDAEDRLRPVTSSASKRPSSPDPSRDEGAEGAKKRPKSVVVKLKYKKPQREGILRILKTRPTPSKRPSSPTPTAKTINKQEEKVGPERRNGEHKEGKAGKTVTQHKGTAAKRPLADDDRTGPAAKRREPSTPARSNLPSPLANSSVHRELPPTPNTRILSQSMRRDFSQDGSTTMETPPAMSETPSTNGIHAYATGHKRPPSSQPSLPGSSQQPVWETEQKRLEVLGRELKHAASSVISGDAPDDSIEKASAVKSLESLLCYFLAFTCCDEVSLHADPKQNPSYRPWRSMQGLYSFVRKKCEAYPILSGLTSALGVSLNAHITSLAMQYPMESMDTALLVHTNRALVRAAREANTLLSVDILQKDLESTWVGRWSGRLELPTGPEYTAVLVGPYQLPIDITTPPFRAARAVYTALKEWLAKEELQYELKLMP